MLLLGDGAFQQIPSFREAHESFVDDGDGFDQVNLSVRTDHRTLRHPAQCWPKARRDRCLQLSRLAKWRLSIVMTIFLELYASFVHSVLLTYDLEKSVRKFPYSDQLINHLCILMSMLRCITFGGRASLHPLAERMGRGSGLPMVFSRQDGLFYVSRNSPSKQVMAVRDGMTARWSNKDNFYLSAHLDQKVMIRSTDDGSSVNYVKLHAHDPCSAWPDGGGTRTGGIS
jgi:hypothetical protein